MGICHPKRCRIAVSYSQALQVRRIYSEWEKLLQKTEHLKYHLVKRGYLEQQLDLEIHQANHTSVEGSLLCRHWNTSNYAPLVVMYHLLLASPRHTFRQYHHILQLFKGQAHLHRSLPSDTQETFWGLFIHATLCSWQLPVWGQEV